NISKQTTLENEFDEAALAILSQIGIIGENGYKDILDILNYMFNYDQKYTLTDGIPALKDIFIEIITEKSTDNLSEQMLKREIKTELKENQPLQSSNVQINNRKFLQSLYFEIKKII